MTNDKEQLSNQEFLQSVVNDPVLFAERILGVTLWRGEVEILRSVQQNVRTAIKACHGAGKTFALAIAVLWWLARYEDGVVLSTAPTFRQVGTQLWTEIHRLTARSRFSYPEFNKTGIKLRGDSNFAIGLSTNRAENFQGYHMAHGLIVVDEATGVEPEIWDAIAGTQAGGQVHLVMAGNPTTPSGPFYDAFSRERELWNRITLDVLDTPNLERLSIVDLLAMDQRSGGPLDENPVPYLATRRWVRNMYLKWWHGNEESSPSWMARVRGQFPLQSSGALFRLAWLERAKQRALENPVSDDGSTPLIAGVDVGGGEAETVVYVCESTHNHYRIVAMGAWRAEDTRGQVVNFLNQFRFRLSTVRVDASGIGFNFGLHLRDCRFLVELIFVGSSCESKPQLRHDDPARRFANLKAQFYQTVADALERDQVDGLDDETTIGQLAGILCEFDSQGRIKIESKEQARARGFLSPDRADALMLAIGRPRPVYEYRSVRDLRHRSSSRCPDTSDFRSSKHPYFGFNEVPDDEDDDNRIRRRRSRRGWESF